MLIRSKRSWELPEAAVTPESHFFGRRTLLAAAAAASLPQGAAAQRVGDDPTVTAYPFAANPRYQAAEPVTAERHATTYNNFVEFGSGKSIQKAAQSLVLRPWTIKIDGLVEKPLQVDFDTLFAAMPREERVYRFRCVEAWAMVVPWSGFPLKALMAYAKPLAGAKYVRFESFLDPAMATGQKSRLYPWPYREGLTIEEATSELPMLVSGAYGKPLARQSGAPLRLIVPWKYGFKSIKSIRKISFVAERPGSLWNDLQAEEYGFWANVNPDVPHPRWSQASEEQLGSGERVKTRLFNGYADEVAHLYKDIKGEKLFT